EDWGGKYQCQGISAKTGEGVEELLEKVLLEAEMLNLKTNKKGMAQGVIIESTIKKGRGFLATSIVQEGTLKPRDIVVSGSFFGKVKAIFTTEGKSIKEAPPSMPLQLLGLNGAPPSGATFQVVSTEQEARNIASKYKEAIQEQKLRAKQEGMVKRFEKLMFEGPSTKAMNFVLKGDTDGSVGALADSLTTLSTDEAEINIIHKGVGDIIESDVIMAGISDATIIGFHTKIDKNATVAIAKEKVNVKTYHIIYEALDDVKKMIEERNQPEEEEIILGKADVVRVFNISRVGKVAGCIVTKGIIKRNAMMRIMRKDQEVYTNKITQLRREKEVIKEAKKDSECGISTGDFEVQEGDVILCFEIKK
ncbi:MAG: translation initiation factor IF-2, partial [Cytophagales bacterium]